MLGGAAGPGGQDPCPGLVNHGVMLLRRDKEIVLTDAQAVLLSRMSAATIDRRLAPERAKLFPRGRSHTKSGRC